MKVLWLLPMFLYALNLHANYQGDSQGYYYNSNPNNTTPQYYRQAQSNPQSNPDISAQSNTSTQDYYSQQPQTSTSAQQGYFSQQPQTTNTTPNTSSSDFTYADKYPRDTFTTEADHTLNARIRKKFSGWLKDNYEFIILHTDNGIVVIDGFVTSDDDRRKLSDAIRSIPGVRSVNNNAQVQK